MQVVDQLGNTIVLEKIPTRIVSLVPSQTELLFDLGLASSIVGITKFCIHPKQNVAVVKKVGGTKNCRIDIIDSLEPDLIIANKEENTASDIEHLQRRYPVYVSDIATIDDAYKMIRDIGLLLDRLQPASDLVDTIKKSFKTIHTDARPKAIYLIWRKPWMSVGSDTFIHSMLDRLGFDNMMGTAKRYPEISSDELRRLQPHYLLLSSEPFPFKQRHVDELQLLCPNANIILVDGEIFSWYGSRMQYAAEYFKNTLVPFLE